VNLQELVDRARSLSGIRLQSVRSDEQVEQVVNESYQEVLGLQPWPFLRGEATVPLSAGQATFTLPQEFRTLTSVLLTMGSDTTRLKQTTVDVLDEYEQDNGETAFYARETDRQIRLWPPPRQDATVEVKGQLQYDLLQGSRTPVFAEQFHPVLAYRAATRMLVEEGDDSGRSESYQLEASGYFQRMERYYLASGDIGLIRIGSSRRGRLARRY
jgi:hypothetical protein